MCRSCYAEYGAPTLDNDRVRRAAALIALVYEDGGVGGTAHVVVDDWNLEDECIDLALAQSAPGSVEHDCLTFLRTLTDDERASALGLYEEFWVSTTQDVR